LDRSNEHSTSLNKYISETGVCSRRAADKIIKEGRVKINGTVAILGNRVFDGDTVSIDDKPLSNKPKAVYIAFNKPRGIVCTTDLKERDNIIDYIGYPERLFPIGRLDKPSEGLIFLTNDGDIVNKILRAGNNHQKEYIVTTDIPISNKFIQKMGAGVPILDTVTQKCFVTKVDTHTFKIVLTQGLNRQIRRMCAYLGYEVTSLRRIRIMNIRIDGIAQGKWRNLTTTEMQNINSLVSNSSKTAEASIDENRKKRL